MTGDGSHNYLTVYRQPERDDFLKSARVAPPFYDRAARAWIVVEPDRCRELLSAPGLLPAPALEHYRNMPSGFGEAFASVAFAFEHIPLSMYGERHAEARRRASTWIAARHQAIHAWAAASLPGHLEAFARPGRVELMAAVIRPLVRGLFATLVAVDLPGHLALDDVSLVFDKSIGMSRRVRLEVDMAALEAHLRDRMGPAASDDEVGMRLGLLVVGKDALVGTLAESLANLLEAHAGQPLGSIAFPKLPQRTAVPFVERIAMTALQAGGLDLAEGDRGRIVLQTYGQGPAAEHHRFFGAGAHACLGRPLSIELWGAIAARLATLSTRVEVCRYELPLDSYVFNVPSIFEVDVCR